MKRINFALGITSAALLSFVFLTSAAYAANAGRWTGATVIAIKPMTAEAVSPDVPNTVLVTLNIAPDIGYGSTCGASHDTQVVVNLAAAANAGSGVTFSTLQMVRESGAYITVFGTNTCNIISGYETVSSIVY